MDNQYRNDNPDLPSLDPWVIRTKPPSERFFFERNPYFHRVDPEGRQLPYIDRVVMVVTGGALVPAKSAAGAADLQARGLRFSDYTFLRENERRSGYAARLWRTAKGSHIALFPNLNVNDPGWRQLFRDVRFRRALSLGINREEINQIVYFGLAIPGNNTVLPESPLFKPAYQERWAAFDPRRASALLDELGLNRRNPEGVRLMADGRPLEIIVETPGEDIEQTDVLQIVSEQWKRIGVKLYVKPSQRELLRNRVYAGETQMSVWSGIENGVPTAALPPDELAPTAQVALHWPKWGQYHETHGKAGDAPDDEPAKQLLALTDAWRTASTAATREQIWHEMLEIWTDQIYTLGIISAVPQPVVVSRHLSNVPEDGVYNWDPGAQMGIYRTETFFFSAARIKSDQARREAQR
jgi:peptide/nickel transport system substrate-binding protein